MPSDSTAVEGLPSRIYWSFSGGQRRLSTPSLAAVQVTDSGLAAYPAVRCVVPRLRRLSVLGARHALLRADCRLGTVRVRRSASAAQRLHVVRQAATPRTTHAAAYRVSVTLG